MTMPMCRAVPDVDFCQCTQAPGKLQPIAGIKTGKFDAGTCLFTQLRRRGTVEARVQPFKQLGARNAAALCDASSKRESCSRCPIRSRFKTKRQSTTSASQIRALLPNAHETVLIPSQQSELRK